jgi:hypothetical protein
MRVVSEYFHCGNYLRETLGEAIGEVQEVISTFRWVPSLTLAEEDGKSEHQTAYNRVLGARFIAKGWEPQPILRRDPKLIGDFRKGLVFVEIQFGNSSALYRDYYKFQYGLANGLLSLAVLIVPHNPAAFFPTRPASVQNMAEYSLAHRCLTVLPINVPTLLIGLMPEN